MAWTPTRVRANVRCYVVPLDKPARVPCEEHGDECAGLYRQHYALTLRVGESEYQAGLVTAEGHEE